ncbi:diguanylate cyclase [Geoalkalibacter halelectricus]|uniref:diguanylate cyclase n=1 Tax=Geoalkalibacter halelectricus TaxID=2847045 RepID=A0ABY5ZNY7_9BACT|nr:diguanylate cyclase [Geoalkalibacter halelectricus]MDO3377463.1 diguanylate cyclase [Geoalkalibacter halelectricus]UWZ80778.1 diguanylate cyclase [Geoalkalibacter halelectricus]
MGRETSTMDDLTALSPMELLESLQTFGFLAPYSLALYCEIRGLICPERQRFNLFGPCGQSPLCDDQCRPHHENALTQTINRNQPNVFRCKSGLLNFIVPFKLGRAPTCCLLGGGIRAADFNLAATDHPSLPRKLNELGLAEAIEQLPVRTEDELLEVARQTAQLLTELRPESLLGLAFEKTMTRFNAIVAMLPAFDRASSSEDVWHLVGETLTVLFDLPRAGVILTGAREPRPALRCLGQWLENPVPLSDEQISLLLGAGNQRRFYLEDEDSLKTLPQVKGDLVHCLSLMAADQSRGTLAIFDADLAPRDLLLIELLAGRAAMRLTRLEQEREQQLEAGISAQIIQMISDLSLLDRREVLFQRILDLSAELLCASKGSLMVLDEDGENLYIAAGRGMNPELARNMKVRVGHGIAGRVVSNGHPLLVNDIEKDDRIRSTNRPRFRTKSFISIPLKVQGEIFAVLNLSDKESQACFDDTDLRMLCSFAPHFSALIERTASLERAAAMEELSITDPLTSLYNRRFLERRLEEEISRSLRQNLSLTLVMLDLDNFKHYNDLCGHLAGDKALKRTARILRHSAREMDIVTRFGGEEFCILLPGTSKKESLLVAERIRHAIEKESYLREQDLPSGKLTASMGIASFPGDGNTPRTLINAADIALYRAKSEGRNRSVLFDLSLRADQASSA